MGRCRQGIGSVIADRPAWGGLASSGRRDPSQHRLCPSGQQCGIWPISDNDVKPHLRKSGLRKPEMPRAGALVALRAKGM